MRDGELKHRRISYILAVGAAFFYVVLIFCKSGIFFETNDDRCISEILGGVLAVEPDAHAVYLNYWLALPISLLYRISGTVPWYGAFLILSHIISYGVILCSVCSVCRNKLELALGTLLSFLFFFSFNIMLSQIQYTSAAALLAIAGYVCLILHKKSPRSMIVFGAVEMLALLMRKNAMLMIQPYGLGVCLGLVLAGRTVWKEKMKAFGGILLVLLGIYLTAELGDFLPYRGTDWDNYTRFNDANVELYDIYGTPEYEEVRDILDRYAVTETEYQAFRYGTLLGWNISPECGEELAAYAKTHSGNGKEPGEILAGIKRQFLHENQWNINKLLLVSLALLTVYLLLRKSYYLLLPTLGMCAAGGAVWGYLIWLGRYPKRVILPLFVCETAFILALFFYDYLEKKANLVERIYLLFCCAVFCSVGFSSGRTQYYYSTAENREKKVFMEGMWEMQEYCRSHPEKRYLIETYTLNYYTGSALDGRITQPRNSIVTGCWYSNSPPMSRKMAAYLGGVDEVCLIICKDGGQEGHPTVRYLAEAWGSEPVWEDEFTLSHGGCYVVYSFELP